MRTSLLRPVAMLTMVAAIATIAWLGSGRLTALSKEPVAGAQPAAVDSLADDGRIGKVSDAQGLVVLRPALAQRWTPVGRETLLKPGDWLRADIRGANAATVRFVSGAEITLGPGTLVECISATQARLHSGEAQVVLPGRGKAEGKPDNDNEAIKGNKGKEQKPGGAAAFELLAPRAGGRKLDVPGKVFLRVDRNEQLVEIEESPKWLAGFESVTSNESLGSLIVNLPDGRSQPLSVGYHKVSVEIRDQIARTTIEESFVNHSDARLEGIFNFPLPQDASVSGFGMWIGDALIEADVVEKQRASEIYETILHEKRDPALLEWTSGNLFKARVFPIEGRSEKRVRIVYTQVLPLQGNRYRYVYGLRSDLLRLNPVRELSLEVTINSAIRLKSVVCPTHATRTEQTDHAARIEFAAQECSPDRDFEVVCEIDGKQPEVVVVPHRRGSDGYLLIQLTPPLLEGNWRRELLTDGPALNVVLLCDTSGSMDSEKRKQQADFVATVLASLGDKDRFMLAAADVSTAGLPPDALAPTADNIHSAEDFLQQRTSLGWTDLDQAFDAVLSKSPANAHIIYVGDGIVSARNRDPTSFVKRLQKRWAEKHNSGLMLHAVTVGNTSESAVMHGIASVGGGSTRAIGGSRSAPAVALELLSEIAQPGLRDLNVEFRGLKVAAVYPEQLPNLPAGMQQIVVGRYLPDGQDQQGEIVVTGRRGAEPVRYATKIRFEDSEQDNSFIPRLWARSHLDHLLDQGDNAANRERIIGLSEEFHIITPYTSLLVLETDADRERFGVKRRYGMSDGEQFFAAGKAEANFALAQQQSKLARQWRVELRQKVLHELATHDRDDRMFRPAPDDRDEEQIYRYLHDRTWSHDENEGAVKPGIVNLDVGEHDWTRRYNRTLDTNGAAIALGLLPDLRDYQGGRVEFNDGLGGGVLGAAGLESTLPNRSRSQRQPSDGDDSYSDDESGDSVDGLLNINRIGSSEAAPGLEKALSPASDDSELASQGSDPMEDGLPPDAGQRSGAKPARSGNELHALRALGAARSQQAAMSACMIGEVTRYFPDGYGFAKLPLVPNYSLAQECPGSWTPAAYELSRSLLRLDSLRALAGGIELRTADDTFESGWPRPTAHREGLVLYSRAGWLTRPTAGDGETIVNFCHGQQRGAYSLAYLLGQVRQAAESDFSAAPFDMSEGSLIPLHETHGFELARVEPAGKGRANLIVTQTFSREESRYLIDTDRHVLLRAEAFKEGRSKGVTTYSDFVQVAGSWWARRQVASDASGHKLHESKLEIAALEPDAFADRLHAQLAELPRVQLLRDPLPRIGVARQHVADGSADFTDRIALLGHFLHAQQWDQSLLELAEAEKLAPDKPGIRWLRTFVLAASRRHDDGRQRLLDEARRLVANPQADELFAAQSLVNRADLYRAPTERLELLELLQPVADRQPAESHGHGWWLGSMANVYEHLRRMEEGVAVRKRQALAMPWNAEAQRQYVYFLQVSEQGDAAVAWLKGRLEGAEARSDAADEALRTEFAELLGKQAHWQELLKFTTAWIKDKPQSPVAYETHLSALVANNRSDAANVLAEQWLKEAQVVGPLGPERQARLHAATELAHKSAWSTYSSRLDERWVAPLTEASLFFVRQAGGVELTREVLGWSLAETEDFTPLRAKFLGLLQAGVKQLSAGQVEFLADTLLRGRQPHGDRYGSRQEKNVSEVSADEWKPIAASIRTRWEQTADKAEKHTLGRTLESIYRQHFADSELLPFLRQQIRSGLADYRDVYTSDLFSSLLTAPWTEEGEVEAFRLLPQLATIKQPAARLTIETAALYRLVNAMLAGRQALAKRELHDKGHVDRFTRAELAKKLAEFRRTAQQGLVERLATQAKLAGEQQSPIADWLLIERLRLDTRLGQHQDEARSFCWKKLGEAPPKQEPDPAFTADEFSSAEEQQAAVDALMRRRALSTLMNLAARPGADPRDVDRLLEYIDAGIVQGGSSAAAWRRTKYQLLVALDRPDQLERALRDWIRTDFSTMPWRQSLAILLAERGKLDEAIQLFEAARREHLLTADDCWTLADWYLAQNRPTDYEQAKIDALRQMPDSDLTYVVRAAMEPRQQYGTQPPPKAELKEITLLALRALFEKSQRPSYYVDELARLYGATGDFRLLRMTPDILLGRTAEEIYAVLNQLHSGLLRALQSEAAAGEIVARIKQLRAGNLTAIDRRALDLYEVFVERQSAQVENQRAPHAEACLAALRRSEQPQWAEGEPRWMAQFLSQLGSMPTQELQEEQLRELRTLQSAAPADSSDQLQITADLCRLLDRNYRRQAEAIQMLAAGIHSYEQAHQEVLSDADAQVLDEYVRMLERAGQYFAGEKFLQTHLKNSSNAAQRHKFENRLWNLYNHALAHGGEVSLGKGKALLQALIEYGFRQIGATGDGDERPDEKAADGKEPSDAAAQGNAPSDAVPNEKIPNEKTPNDEAPQGEASGADAPRTETPPEDAPDIDAAKQGDTDEAEADADTASMDAADVDEQDDNDWAYESYSDDPRGGAVNKLLRTFEIAHKKHIADIAEPLRTFAFATMPAILARHNDEHGGGQLESQPTFLIGEVLGPVAELRYIVERMEQWPKRLEQSRHDAWSSFGHHLAEVRLKADTGAPQAGRRRRPNLPQPRAKVAANAGYKELEPRVLKLVIAELKLHLRTGELGNFGIFEYPHYNTFWNEKVDDFARAAHEVFQESKSSGSTAVRCAEYLGERLDRRDAALEILLTANKAGQLDVAEQQKLIGYLHAKGKYAESIPFLEPMVRAEPDVIELRGLLMVAYFRAQQPAPLAELVQQTERHFHSGGRWTEDNISNLAQACSDCQLHEKAIAYFKESIAEHRRAKTDVSQGDEVLSKRYQQLARAQSAVGDTKAAVDSATAAIVSCPPSQYWRNAMLALLRDVLKRAPDLDAYVQTLDQETSKSKQDSPLVRKSIGQVYQERQEYERAVAQFKIAIELQPGYQEPYQAIIACYDALDQPAKATGELLALIDFDRHDLKLYQQLAGRFETDKTEAERAATSIVEAGPAEADNHRALAEFRERQNRWNEAISEWTEVAKLRPLEPTGLLGLAKAQAHEKQWKPLKQTLDSLQATRWPDRFAVELQEVESLREELPK